MCSEQPQFHFWNETFLLESEMLAFVHSIRIADFQLYCESLTELLPMILQWIIPIMPVGPQFMLWTC